LERVDGLAVEVLHHDQRDGAADGGGVEPGQVLGAKAAALVLDGEDGARAVATDGDPD